MYSYVGGMLTGGAKILVPALFILFAARGRSLFWCGSFTASMRHGKEGADAAPVLMLCQAMSNLRVRFRHISYGDQGLFIESDLFF